VRKAALASVLAKAGSHFRKPKKKPRTSRGSKSWNNWLTAPTYPENRNPAKAVMMVTRAERPRVRAGCCAGSEVRFR
jgi:hypothetical protein